MLNLKGILVTRTSYRDISNSKLDLTLIDTNQNLNRFIYLLLSLKN